MQWINNTIELKRSIVEQSCETPMRVPTICTCSVATEWWKTYKLYKKNHNRARNDGNLWQLFAVIVCMFVLLKVNIWNIHIPPIWFDVLSHNRQELQYKLKHYLARINEHIWQAFAVLLYCFVCLFVLFEIMIWNNHNSMCCSTIFSPHYIVFVF